jgi:SNF2 family DNA or RNA helicase
MKFENQEYIINKNSVIGNSSDLEELIENEWIREVENDYLLNEEDYLILDSYYKSVLGFPSEFKGKLKILLNGAGINIEGAKIELEFLHYNNIGRLERVAGCFENGLITFNGKSYSPKPHHLKLLGLIAVYNSPESKTDKLAAFIQFGRIKKFKLHDDIIFDSYLDAQEIIVPEGVKLNVSINDETEEITIKPEIDGVVPDSFIQSFDRRPIVSADYRIKDDNKTKRIFFPLEENGIKDELEKIKSNPIFTGDRLKELVENPSRFFNLELTDVEALFGDRVLGLSPFLPTSLPIVNQKGSEWIPGFKIEDEYVLINDEIEYLVFKNAIVQALEEESKFILFKAKKLRLETARLIERIAKLIFEKKGKVTEAEIKKIAQGEVLIVKDNIEEVEYAADFSLFEKLKSASLVKANNLKNKFQLKGHQVEGISWMQEVKNKLKATGALLADDMGLGKTLQILYFLESIYQSEKLKKPSLIIAPSSLLENWKNEYDLFFDNPSLEFVIIDKDTLPLLEKERKNPSPTLYLTTYEGMRMKAIHFCTVDWAIVALDEAQKIKNPSALVTHAAKGIKADFKIAMTGTPVENILLDLWSIIDFCTPGLLGSAKGFNKGIKSGELTSEVIRDKIEPVFIRRLKSDVAKDLPLKSEHVIREEMPERQLEMYNQMIAQLSYLKSHDKLTKPALLQSIHELRKVSDHPELSNDGLIEDDVDFNSSAKINIVETLLNQIRDNSEKVILFTERRKMQYLLKKFCETRFNISPSIINGDVPSTAKENTNIKTRQGLVNEFQSIDGFNIIIMSPIAAGFGLNVVGANNVIHYTRHWNPAKEQQATDRVYRIGQTKDVNIYYPMAVLPDSRKSFDEILDKKLSSKKALADDLLFPTERIQVTNDDILDDLIN